MYISEIVFIGLFVTGFIFWRKYKDRDFLWALIVLGGSLILSVLQYLSETFLELSEEARVTEGSIFLWLRGIAFVVFLFIFLKTMLKKKG